MMEYQPSFLRVSGGRRVCEERTVTEVNANPITFSVCFGLDTQGTFSPTVPGSRTHEEKKHKLKREQICLKRGFVNLTVEYTNSTHLFSDFCLEHLAVNYEAILGQKNLARPLDQ